MKNGANYEEHYGEPNEECANEAEPDQVAYADEQGQLCAEDCIIVQVDKPLACEGQGYQRALRNVHES